MRKTSFKKDFINYCLYNYEFKDHTAVWILNFIKSHPLITHNISFTKSGLSRKLRIAEKRTNRPTLMFEKNGTVTADGETIFHELNLNKTEELYVEFIFSKNDVRYNQAKTEELMKNDEILLEDIKELEVLIDEALVSKDKERFFELTDELQKLNDKRG
ncbi:MULTISPECIES: YpiB family protein [Jeotgalicoccus]|uniref:Uncharacterized protein YpiB (UPF0302 family) n=2 Tax=Jeotgalicoccus TaxID=227979 RepID=A0A3E0B0V9_9STAP|nr:MULTISPECIES: YpiB family protein [Jeotgalicoccus]MBF0753379.1 YpiB family protein [Jeotgalicoccus nanhaiensis]REG25616.1 uncharacterized protein YpiB (UPF0302 family) [Jeotgalicoccus halotolerans]TFU62542.1 IDEAL domain-containing protein [Jeotgalicoccus nanhaiensis]